MRLSGPEPFSLWPRSLRSCNYRERLRSATSPPGAWPDFFYFLWGGECDTEPSPYIRQSGCDMRLLVLDQPYSKHTVPTACQRVTASQDARVGCCSRAARERSTTQNVSLPLLMALSITAIRCLPWLRPKPCGGLRSERWQLCASCPCPCLVKNALRL